MLTRSDIDAFVETWFEGLNRHIDVEQMLSMVSTEGLEMVFPETTIRGQDDFRRWYSAVGASFTAQQHTWSTSSRPSMETLRPSTSR